MKMKGIKSRATGEIAQRVNNTAYSLFITMLHKKQYSGVVTFDALIAEMKLDPDEAAQMDYFADLFLSVSIDFEAQDQGVSVNRNLPLFSMGQYSVEERKVWVELNPTLIKLSPKSNVSKRSHLKH